MDALLKAIANHWFWSLLMAAVVVWYSTVTIYVAIKGMVDIKGMLGRLKNGGGESSADADQGPKA